MIQMVSVTHVDDILEEFGCTPTEIYSIGQGVLHQDHRKIKAIRG